VAGGWWLVVAAADAAFFFSKSRAPGHGNKNVPTGTQQPVTSHQPLATFPMTSPAPAAERQFLVFMLADTAFGLPIEAIAEIVQPRASI
jgi:hypothetical protein